ncbi:MAG: molybdopterin-dependent oxidoreductase [Verrucomicrobiae bacterium]|nr:molybdopterin-dependent oxidoreductase [Verrucomicrobiae bacterium]
MTSSRQISGQLASEISRRRFAKSAVGMVASAMGASQVGGQDQAGSVSVSVEGVVSPHPFLTPAEDFYTVARGNPKPHTLQGQALIDARMTPETWRLEIAPDGFSEPPDIKESAKAEKSLTLADGTALDLPALEKLGETHGVKYLKAMQCLNIAEPLGQGLWEGVPLRDVLRLCGKLENVRRIYYLGFHNHDPKQIFQSSVSYTQAMETPPGELPAFLAYRLNGEPIPPVRGGPVRMIVPWAHGFKSIKWLQQIYLTNDYRTNDTYALKNNDPESYLKTAAYVDDGPESSPAGKPVTIVGRVISGLSGFQRLETFLRTGLKEGDRRLGDDELREATWETADILPPPNWKLVLPEGVASRDLLGFDPKTGDPLSWPTRYGMASWVVTMNGLKPGRYELYARTIDHNGDAQPEPRPMRKAGKNEIQSHRFEVV